MKTSAALFFVGATAVLTAIGGACSQPQGLVFPTHKTRNVPLPAPAPWMGAATYTEQTYKIDVKVGQKFAIGMHVTNEYIAPSIIESHDINYMELIGSETVPYDAPVLNNYGTKWFLFKAIKAGKTEVNYSAPLEYFKVFSVSIK